MPFGPVIAVARRHLLLFSTFVLSAAIALFFAGHFIFHAIYWELHQNEPIRPWMTPGYIARSWNIDRTDLARRLGVPDDHDRHRTLKAIAAEKGVPVATLMAEVQQTLDSLAAQAPGVPPR